MKKLFVLSAFTFLLTFQLQAQTAVVTESDSLIVESQDTVLLKSYATRYNPRKALLFAAVLPLKMDMRATLKYGQAMYIPQRIIA